MTTSARYKYQPKIKNHNDLKRQIGLFNVFFLKENKLEKTTIQILELFWISLTYCSVKESCNFSKQNKLPSLIFNSLKIIATIEDVILVKMTFLLSY